MALTTQFVYAGQSIPPYGNTGDVLVKTDNAFYYTGWSTIANIINSAGDNFSISGVKIDAYFGEQTLFASGISLYKENGNSVGFIAPSGLADSFIWTLPSGDGTSGQVLATTGSGVLYWTTGGGGGGGASVVISTTPPVSASEGDIWFDSDAGRSYVYYNDGDSSQWVEMNPSWNGTFASGSGYTISFASGTAGSPSIYFPFADTGLFMPADRQIGVTTSGVARFLIGTDSIEAELPITVSGDLTLKNQSNLKLADADNSNYVALQAPTTLSSNQTITLPDVSGTVVTTGDTGSVTSTMILDGTIVNGDINASAAIAGTKISPDFGSQNIVTTGDLTVDTDTLYVDSTNNRVGLGTSTPGTILDARGIISVGSSSLANAVIQKSAVPGGSYNLTITAGGGLTSESATTPTDALAGSVIKLLGGDPATDTFGGGIQYYANGSTSPNGAGVGNQHVFYTRSATNTYTERVRIDASGRLGVGTTSPAQLLHLTSTGSNAFLQFSDSGSGGSAAQVRIGSNGNDLVVLNNTSSNTATERMRIDSNGRLLVGTSSTVVSSTAVLQGRSGVTTGEAILRLCRGQDTPADAAVLGDISFGDSNNGDAARIFAQRDGGTWTSATSRPSRLVFSTTADGASSPTERMRITSAGKTLVNLQTPSGGFIETSCGNDVNIRANVTSGGGVCYDGRYTLSTGTVYFGRWIYNGSTVGSITSTGSTTAYNTSSDYRLKENIVAVSDGITRLQQLKPSRFNFIADPAKTVDGFLAHEVQTVVPEAITGEKDAVDENGDPQYQGIDQSKLVPLLTAALQEALTEIENLKARVTALES